MIPAAQEALRPDCEALWAFYTNLDDPGVLDDPVNSHAWRPTTPLDQWQGVWIGSGGVEALVLPDAGLTGSIAPELRKLTNITSLDLSGNQLDGPIPPELGQLINLETLFLHNNQLTGPIPKKLGQLINLEVLELSGNQLDGPIPPELGQLIDLRGLFLHNNRLTGPIPKKLGQLINLEVLELSGNKLDGPIPPELGQLIDLRGLFLHNNRLTGPIPKKLGQLISLEQLFLYDNRLTGPIPPELGQLSNLLSLDLSDNGLTGEIPSELGQLTKLGLLRLDGNRLADPGSTVPFASDPSVSESATTLEELPEPSPVERFSDDDANVHEANIEIITALGITVGCNPPENDHYCPDGLVTRAQMMAFLARALGESGEIGKTSSRFLDVPGDAWYVPSLERLADLGIVEPGDGGTFRPHEPLARVDMAVFLTRAFPAISEVTQPVGVFSDVATDAEHAGAVEGILAAGGNQRMLRKPHVLLSRPTGTP